MTNEDIVGLIRGVDKVKFIATGLGESELTTFELKFLVDAYEFQQELARCKDCGYGLPVPSSDSGTDDGWLLCEFNNRKTHTDGYCDYGWRDEE